MTEENRASSFDELTRGLASGSISRGRALKLMGAALVGGTLASLGIGEAAADQCKRAGKACKKNTQCCSGNCDSSSGTCAACPVGRMLLENGTCALRCESHTECPSCGSDPLCGSTLSTVGFGYCSNLSVITNKTCFSDINCNAGQYCGAASVCVSAC